MIWIVKDDVSHQIISCNIHSNDNNKTYELWVTRPNGKNLKIKESPVQEEITIIKNAIDYAIEHGESVLRL